MRNTKIVILVLGAVVGLLMVWTFLGGTGGKDARYSNRIKAGDKEVMVEIADSNEKRAQGLSGRESLGENQGMLFVFPDAMRRSFWMKDMHFPLDILFIRNGEISEIARKVPAPGEGEDGTDITLISNHPASAVLEVNSGWAERHDIQVGDKVEFVR